MFAQELNAMADIDTSLFETLRREMLKIREAAAAAPATGEVPHPENIIGNTGLLLDTLQGFYVRSGKAQFLPGHITSSITSKLKNIVGLLAPLVVSSADQTSTVPPKDLMQILEEMDGLYAYCLKYGLISFGLDPKVAQQRLEELRGYVAEVESASRDATGKLNTAVSKLSQEVDGALASVAERRAAYEKSVDEQVKAIEPQVAAVVAHAGETTALSDAAKKELESLQKICGDAVKAQNELADLLTLVTEQSKKIVESANLALTNSQVAEKQTSELSATAKAQAQAATDAKAGVNQQLESITAFYGEIERHKKQMLDLQNEATATATALKKSTDETLADLKGRTDQIVATNEKLIGQIKDHLRKAIGISLFTAFDKRRGSLFWGMIVWALLLTGGLVVAVVAALKFANAVATAQLDTAVILARLLMGIPVAFWVVFAARQYSRERRAQEEYAFKATISVSLDPYRELIEKMRTGPSAQDIPFLEDRIKDIFDNPTHRLYPVYTDDESEAGGKKPPPSPGDG
jgi:predicted  nucleic acid-binding Zn-ribbon protein